MARGKIRSVCPEQWLDSAFGRLTWPARQLTLGIRNHADDNGIFVWDPLELQVRILPFNPEVDAKALLSEMIEQNQIMRYAANQRDYGMIRNFQLFQRPDRPYFRYPPPPGPLPPGYTLNKAYDGPERPRAESKRKTKSKPLTDVFAGDEYPVLKKHYAELGRKLQAANPDATMPNMGAEKDFADRKVLADLVRLDNFSEHDVVDALIWLFEAEHRDAEFWRGNVLSFSQLRKKCRNDLTKFQNIHMKWRKAEAKPNDTGIPENVEEWT